MKTYIITIEDVDFPEDTKHVAAFTSFNRAQRLWLQLETRRLALTNAEYYEMDYKEFESFRDSDSIWSAKVVLSEMEVNTDD